MKNQYVGDINDFLKYALLRELQASLQDKPLFVAWMLTPDDQGPDGNQLSYLSEPDKYEAVDPELFEVLGDLVEQGDRSVSAIQESAILSPAEFFDELVPKDKGDREQFGSAMADACPDGALVFFDPDNGMEIKKRSPKHLEWEEFRQVTAGERSFVIYQHNPMPKGGLDLHFESLKAKAEELCPGTKVLVVRGPHAGFLVGAIPDEYERVRGALERFSDRWPANLKLS